MGFHPISTHHFVPVLGWLVAQIACRSPGEPEPSPATELERTVSEAYQREFGARVPRPAIFVDPAAGGCPLVPHLMTTAYLPDGGSGSRRLLMLYLTLDGTALTTAYEGGLKIDAGVRAVFPAGTFRVLTVLVRYPETVSDATVALLSQAQAEINAQHQAFATTKGYSAPIVRFVFENVAIFGSAISDPRSLGGVTNALAGVGRSTSGSDFVVVLNPDPAKSEGGFAAYSPVPPYFVYMGNYGPFTHELSASQVTNIARAAYHHEIGHHWGWRHDWTPTCGATTPFAPFITAPTLFGWEDTDGNGVPEILDSSPYGR